MLITNPSGERILHASIFKRCEVLVEGVILEANLISLEMNDFDVILEMDWLSNHQTLLDCFTKKIMFKKPRYSDLEFWGNRKFLSTCVISILDAKRLLHKGCKTYLAYVIDKSMPKVTLDDVPIVRELFDVFFEDLSSLPPEKN